MPRPAPAFQRVDITPNISVKFRKTVLELFPEAPAFVRDVVREKQVSVATAMEYARRVSVAIRNDHLHHPELSTYSTELTAVNAYWKWVAAHYERRAEKVFTVCGRHGHYAVRRRFTHLTVGCLARPWPGKQIVSLDPTKFFEGASVTLRPSDRWTLHIPYTRKDGTLELPPHGHEDPGHLCTACEVMELHDDELQAVAEAFYDAWGDGRDPFSLPLDAPLFGRPPLVGAFKGAEPPPPITGLLALLPAASHFEKLVMRMNGARTGTSVHLFLERLREASADVVVLDRTLLQESDPTAVEALVAELRQWMTPTGIPSNGATTTPEHVPAEGAPPGSV